MQTGLARALLSITQRLNARCPCHSFQSSLIVDSVRIPSIKMLGSQIPHAHTTKEQTLNLQHTCSLNSQSFSHKATNENAFETASSRTRFGRKSTMEVPYDLEGMGSRNVLIFTDATIRSLQNFTSFIQSFSRIKSMSFTVFDQISIEPTLTSVHQAIDFALSKTASGARPFDAMVAFGGGSVMDTAKLVNVALAKTSTWDESKDSILDFVEAPIGKSRVIGLEGGIDTQKGMLPLICIPTTAGTGSEVTGTAVFYWEDGRKKTGISHRSLRPTLAVVDPDNAQTMPTSVAVASGFDVLCHALESYTVIPFYERGPAPKNPWNRPAYQGSNPVSDIWCLKTLEIMRRFFLRSIRDPEDMEAREKMCLASLMAGVGFGNAGLHAPHAMSYAVSGLSYSLPKTPQYQHPSYPIDSRGLIPHGVSVVLGAPATFRMLNDINPHRNAEALTALLGLPWRDQNKAGDGLAEVLLELMRKCNVPLGLEHFGFTKEHVSALTERTIDQKRVTLLSPKSLDREVLNNLFLNSMAY